jgi:hypothetical protein
MLCWPVIVPAEHFEKVQAVLSDECYTIGEIVEGETIVSIE